MDVYGIREWCPVVRKSEELQILGFIHDVPYDANTTPLGHPEQPRQRQLSGAVKICGSGTCLFKNAEGVTFELIGQPQWTSDLEDADDDENYAIKKPIFQEFARTWEPAQMQNCFDGLIDMVVADYNAQKQAEQDIFGADPPATGAKDETNLPERKPPRLSAATTAYNTTAQPTVENLTQRQNQSNAPSGHVSSWLREQESKTQESVSVPNQSTFVMQPPPGFENTPLNAKGVCETEKVANRSITRSQSRKSREKSSEAEKSSKSRSKSGDSRESRKQKKKNNKSGTSENRDKEVLDVEKLKDIPVQRHIHLLHPQMPKWEKEAEELYTWGVELMEDKTVKIISIKAGKKWRSGDVVEVLHHGLPYCFIRTKRRIYKLTGSIDQEISRPKDLQGYIALAFLDGFPHYWTTVRDIIVERARGTEEKLQLERNTARENAAQVQNLLKSKGGGSKNGSKVGSKNGKEKPVEEKNRTEKLDFLLTVPKSVRQPSADPRAPSVMSARSGVSARSDGKSAKSDGPGKPPSQAPMPPQAQKPMPPPAQKPPLPAGERRRRPKKHQEMLEKVKNMPSISGNSSPSFEVPSAPQVQMTPIAPVRPRKNVQMALANSMAAGSKVAKQIFSSTPHHARSRKDRQPARDLVSESTGAMFQVNVSMIEMADPIHPPTDFLSPSAKAHIRKPTESSEEELPPAARGSPREEGITPTFGFGAAKTTNQQKLLRPVQPTAEATSPSEKRNHPKDSSSADEVPAQKPNRKTRPDLQSIPQNTTGQRFEKPSRPMRKRTKQKPQRQVQLASDSESDSDGPATFQYSKKSSKSQKSAKPVEKSTSKKKSKKSKKQRETDEPPEITANKNSKKYREQRQAHLIHNQRSAQVDVTVGEITPTDPQTPPRQVRKPPLAVAVQDLENSLDISLGLDIGDVDQPLPSQEQGRCTPSWFRTPNASDVESQMTTMLNGRQSLATDHDADEENQGQNQMVNNVLTNKLSKKVLKKKNGDKGKSAQKRAKAKLDKRVLTPSNSKDVMRKLNKLGAGKKKKTANFVSSADEDSDSDFNSQETTNDALNV